MKSKSFSVFEVAKHFFESQPVQLKTFDSIESTNTFAKNEAFQISDEAHVYLALDQTHGRGRGVRTWTAASDSQLQLFATWSFSLPKSPQNLTAPLAGLLIFQCLTKIADLPHLGLKPPNDLYVQSKKVAGLLVETVSMGSKTRLIVGLGLNVFAHPTMVPDAGHLSDFVTIDEDGFLRFLTALQSEWPRFLQLCTQQTLNSASRNQLLMAVNSCQVQPQAVLEISESGDLITSSATISWRDL